MANIVEQIEQLSQALSQSSWRCELGTVDPALIARAEARVGALPPDYRAFLSRVVVLENHTGDVRFFSAKDLADGESELARTLAEWRHSDEETARADARTLAEVRGFWDRVVPIVCSTVNGEDFLALDRGTDAGPVIEAWGEHGWSESARVCASDFAHFLRAFVSVAQRGPAAFECGWRLGRKALKDLHELDPQFREALVPVLFVGDFNGAAPARRETRPGGLRRAT